VVGVHPVAAARVAGGVFGRRKNARRAKDDDQWDKDHRERSCAQRFKPRMKRNAMRNGHDLIPEEVNDAPFKLNTPAQIQPT
jgi:hypothetical protein